MAAIRILADDIVDEISKGYEFSQFMGIMLQKPGGKQRQAYQRLLTAVAKIIEQGQTDGVFAKGNPVQLAQFLVSIFQGLSSTQMLLKGRFMLPVSAQIISFLGVKNNGQK